MAEKSPSAVFGVDIVRGSADSGEVLQYALTMLTDEGIEQQRVSQRKLLRLITEMCPEVVAVDSYTELATDKKNLVRLLRRMPASTKLIQVCGVEKGRSLPRVAAEHGIGAQ